MRHREALHLSVGEVVDRIGDDGLQEEVRSDGLTSEELSVSVFRLSTDDAGDLEVRPAAGRLPVQRLRSVLDRLIPLLIEEVEASGERFGSSLIEVVGLLLVVAIRDEGKPFGEVLIDSCIDLSDGITSVLGVQRHLRGRHVGDT